MPSGRPEPQDRSSAGMKVNLVFSTTIFELLAWANLQDVQKVLETHRIGDVPVDDPDWPADELLHRRWTSVDNLPLSVVVLNKETEIDFIATRAVIERHRHKSNWFDVNHNLLEKSERINVIESDVFFFSWNDRVFCVPLTKSSNKLNRLIRDMLQEEIWGPVVVSPSDFCLPSDGFYWMFKVFKFGDRRLSEEPEIRINGLSGYDGHLSTDISHTVSGKGNKIYEVLATMAFLFSNESIDSIKATLLTKDAQFLVVIWSDGSIEIEEADCRAPWLRGRVGVERQALIVHEVYGTLLPTIVKVFEQKRSNGEWTQMERRRLTSVLGKQIISQVASDMRLDKSRTVAQIREELVEEIKGEVAPVSSQ